MSKPKAKKHIYKISKEAWTAEKKLREADAWQSRIAEALVLVLMCALPMYINSERYIGLTGHKFRFFAACMVIALLCTATIWAYRILDRPRLTPNGQPAIADLAVLGFTAVTLLAALLSPFKGDINVWLGKTEPDGRYDGAVTQLCYAAAFFIIAKWYKPRRHDFVIFAFSASAVSIIGILQFYGMDFLELWPAHIPELYVEEFYYIEFRSTLGNINIVSAYACVSVLLCGFLYVKEQVKWRFLYLAASMLCFWLLLLAGSDSGLVGIAAATAIALVFVVSDLKALGRFFVLASAWVVIFTLQRFMFDVSVLGTTALEDLFPYAAAAALLLLPGLLLSLPGRERTLADEPVNWKPGVVLLMCFIVTALAGIEILGRNPDSGIAYQAREMMHGRFDDEFGTLRINIWRNALSVFPAHPVIGTGPDTFYFAYPHQANLDRNAIYGHIVDKAHNEYLQILICQGLAGLACYLVLLVSVFAKAVPRAFKDPLLLGVTAAFLGYCIQAFFNISIPITGQMVWVLAAMMANKRFYQT